MLAAASLAGGDSSALVRVDLLLRDDGRFLACEVNADVAYRGERLAVLYRFYPVEHMEEQANVPALSRATERGELASVSAFSVIHAQSKLAMARAWHTEPHAVGSALPHARRVPSRRRVRRLPRAAHCRVALLARRARGAGLRAR
jgi:hypothetical protein